VGYRPDGTDANFTRHCFTFESGDVPTKLEELGTWCAYVLELQMKKVATILWGLPDLVALEPTSSDDVHLSKVLMSATILERLATWCAYVLAFQPIPLQR
jgi:hypothetical protein